MRRMLELAAQGNVEAQRELLLGSAKVGDVRLQAGDPDGALAAYQENRRVPQQAHVGFEDAFFVGA
jgi:hypothetical protein